MKDDFLAKAVELNQKSNQLKTIIGDLGVLPIIITVGGNESIRLVNDGMDEVTSNIYKGISDLIKAYKQSIDSQFEAL